MHHFEHFIHAKQGFFNILIVPVGIANTYKFILYAQVEWLSQEMKNSRDTFSTVRSPARAQALPD